MGFSSSAVMSLVDFTELVSVSNIFYLTTFTSKYLFVSMLTQIKYAFLCTSLHCSRKAPWLKQKKHKVCIWLISFASPAPLEPIMKLGFTLSLFDPTEDTNCVTIYSSY